MYKKLTTWNLLILLFIISIVIIYLYKVLFPYKEGFSSISKKFELKQHDIYDDFYANIYDDLVYNPNKNNYEIIEILAATEHNQQSRLLDIGSGTGHHVDLFIKKGIKSMGLDSSKAMVKKAKENYPNNDYIQGDVLKSILFDPNTFSHITCFYFTIYNIQNKKLFFQNAYSWLVPNGFLCIHLVNEDNFDPIIEAGNPLLVVSPQKYAKERITNSVVKFTDFEYKSDFKLKGDKRATFHEVIKFKKDGRVRKNEHTLYMNTQKNILAIAKNVGFILIKTIDLSFAQYDQQYIYVLQKPV
jgi:SAM-dependent methyltransferase